jgi:AcrR family transcriptional regulator
MVNETCGSVRLRGCVARRRILSVHTTSTGARPPLDRERILAEALELIEAEGFAQFTMGRLAARLDVTDMALYKYVGSRDEVLDGVVESLLATVCLPDASGDVLVALRGLYGSLWRLFAAHPQVLPVLLARPLTLPAMARCLAGSRALLLACGCPEELTRRTLSTLTAYTLGFASLACGGYLMIESAPPAPARPRTRSRRRPAAACPVLRHGPDWQLLEDDFEAGLETVLQGVREELQGHSLNG